MTVLVFPWAFTLILFLLFPPPASGSYSKTCIGASKCFWPSGVNVGNFYSSQMEEPFRKFTLSSESAFATIDYGAEVAGWPTFHVAALSGVVQIEVKYSEPFDGLGHTFSDGPFAYNEGLMNTFRVESFNVTDVGAFSSPLLQGGQRWQSIQLLTEGSITFDAITMAASVNVSAQNQSPGLFSSDNSVLNDIWMLGVRAASLSCVEMGSQSAVWKIDPVKGAHIQSLRPYRSVKTNSFENYTLEFDAMIGRAGLWWAVAQGFEQYAGLQLQLVSQLPETSTFVNTNRSLTPPNTVRLAYGFAFVNQTTLPSVNLGTFGTPFPIEEGVWYRLRTVLSPTRHLSVFINDQRVFRVSLDDYRPNVGAVPLSGTFGFGAWQDHAVNVRNVVVTQTEDGTVLYTNDMLKEDVLAEYGAQPNIDSVCLDGPKRDRLVWLGDFYHTLRIIGASTGRFDYAEGTINYFLNSQLSNGQLSQSAYLGYDPSLIHVFAPSGHYLLDDYQILGFLSFYYYIRLTSNLAYAQKTWDQWEKQLDWLISKINADDGLMDLDTAFLGPPRGSAAISCAAVQALHAASEIADLLGRPVAASKYRGAAAALSNAINSQLWAPEMGAYSQARSQRNFSSVASTVFCINSKVANEAQRAASFAGLEQLRSGVGYRDTSLPTTDELKISPNINGFLLESLVKNEEWTKAADLITTLWGAMVKSPETSTGASWEYTTADGRPGLDLFTSLSHPWGGAPTYILTGYAAGLRSASGRAGYGYRNWVVNPEFGLFLGLKQAHARIPLYTGMVLAVDWRVDNGTLVAYIQAPRHTAGVFQLGEFRTELKHKTRYQVVVPLVSVDGL